MSDNDIILPDGYDLIVLGITDSTNTRGKVLARDGAPHGTILWATSQTEGRGRLDRQWVSEEGNLYCSLLLKPQTAFQSLGQLSFVFGLAVRDAIKSHNIRLKWPNDVLINGKKVGGILIESILDDQSTPTVIAGIGINIRHFPDKAMYPATSLVAEGLDDVSPENLITNIISAFDDWYTTWTEEGFAPIKESWLSSTIGLDQPIEVRMSDNIVTGRFKMIDDTGALHLEQTDASSVTITTGDVFLLDQGENHAVSH